ncbi:MAG: hypothetical protein DRN15_01150 [Thermoprotei archaeon]|nr:MAG: hypothetical protein DRM97_03315 [Thermoprotei archaeon]RLF24872.1 MAG: hypothetical protein DRN15_01150 [Thermoprotei archaeon]
MIRKAVLTAAGLGTRLLPTTKETPKELLPLFVRGFNGKIKLKPLLQIIFEQLYKSGIRRFCIVTGRGKRAIEDHFTPDYDYLNFLKNRNKSELAEELEHFYRMIESSEIMWVSQPYPKGFGDAVYRAKPYIGEECFLVHAGDTYIVSRNDKHISMLMKIHEETEADAIFLAFKTDNPRAYGVVLGKEEMDAVIKVSRVVEKPERPLSDIAIAPLYIFHPVIFKALETIGPGVGGEVQLTDAIQRLIDWNLKVYAVLLPEDSFLMDIGNPLSYWQALKTSYILATEGNG